MAFKLKSGNKPTFKMMGSTNNMGMNITQAKNAASQGLVPGLGGAFTKTYDEAWAAMDKTPQAKYSDKADFVNQAKRYNEKKYGTTDPTKKAKRLDVSKKELEDINKPKKMDAAKPEKIETAKKEVKMEKREAPEPVEKSKRVQREDKRMDKKGQRLRNQESKDAEKAKKQEAQDKSVARRTAERDASRAEYDKKVQAKKDAKNLDIANKAIKKGEEKEQKILERGAKKIERRTGVTQANRQADRDAKKATNEEKKGQKEMDRRAKKKPKYDKRVAKYMDSNEKKRFDRNVAAEKMVKQADGKITKGQARRGLKRQEKMEAELNKQDTKGSTRKRNKNKKATGPATDSPIGTMSKDPKTPMAKTMPYKNYKKGYYGA